MKRKTPQDDAEAVIVDERPHVPGLTRSASERILDYAAADREVGGAGPAMATGALIDIAEGKNQVVRVNSYAHKDRVALNGLLRRSAPPMLARMAEDELTSGSDQAPYAQQLAAILKNPRPVLQAITDPLKKLLPGGRE